MGCRRRNDMATIEFYQCDFCKKQIPVKRDGFKNYIFPSKQYGFRFECSFCGHDLIDLCEDCYNELHEHIDSKSKETK
jgi:hypothetical protein